MNETIDSIKKKLEKLIRHRDSAKNLGNIQEAEAFALKIQELALKYGIEISKLNPNQQDDLNKVIVKTISLSKHYRRHESRFVISMFHATAKGNMIFAIGSFDEQSIDYVGYEHNIDLAEYLADQLIPRLRELARRDFKKYAGNTKRNTYLRGWYLGAVKAIKERLTETLKSHEANSQAGGLIRRTELEIRQKAAELYPNARLAGGKPLKGVDGSKRGYQAGKNISFSKGVGNSTAGSKFLN